MARILKELIRKPSTISSRFFETFTHQTPTNISPSWLLNQSNLLGQPKFDHGSSNQGLREDTHLSKLQIYPCFSFGCFLDPGSASGLGGSHVVGLGQEMERDGMMWADSVKKKRKKKMNKHKYKKLRKRLRRKTKT